MPWGIAAAAVGAAGAIGGSIISSDASKSAADTQANAQQQAAADQMQMFNTLNGQQQNFIQNGYAANNSISQLLGLTPGDVTGLGNGYFNKTFDPSSITSSPGYQFAQSQGAQQVLNADSPAVGALSGAALKDLTNFSTGTAEQYYNNYFNQFQSQQNNIFSRLSAIAGLGQNAAANVGNNGAQLGTGAAQAIAAAGGSQAAGTIGAGNALAGGLSGAANSASSYLALNQILSNNNSGGSSGPYVFNSTTGSGAPMGYGGGS
jgi:hypothetical protein